MQRRSSLGGDAVKLTFSKLVTLCISMISTMLLSRFRTLEEYGTYSQLLLVINLFTTIFMLGLPNSINYFLARAESQEERRKFLSIYYTLSTLFSVLLGIVLVCAIPLIEAYFSNPLIGKFAYFLAIYPWSTIIASGIENMLVVYRKTNLLAGYRVLNSVCLLGIIFLVQLLDWTFSEYMLLLVGVNAAFAIAVYVLAHRLSGGLRPMLDKSWLKAIFVFSIPMGLASVVGTLNIEIDKLLIGRMLDTTQQAIYSNASKELPVTIIASSITAVLLPQITRMIKRDKCQSAIQLWGYATELSFICICIIVAGVFTFASDAVELLYSAKYLPGVPVFRVYTLVLLLRCTYFGMIMNALGQSKKIFYCSVASLALNAVLNPLLFWVMGTIGPAVATFLSMVIVLVGQLWMTAQSMKTSFRNIFPWKRLSITLLINIFLASVFTALKIAIPLDIYIGSLMESLLLGIFWVGAYFLVMRRRVLYVWRQMNKEAQIDVD